MNNLGYHTDAIFHRLNGEIIDRGDYFLIQTPSNPSFHWGNHLLFKKSPTKECAHSWLDIHQSEFGVNPGHIAIGWDTGEKGHPSPFIDRGFTLHEGIVLHLTGPSSPVRRNPSLEIRPFASESDWQASIELQVADRGPTFSEESYRAFKTDQMSSYQLAQQNGHGHQWGAFLDGELVGDMGLFQNSAGKIGRFQNVGTAKAHRRKRVCTTLLHTVINHPLNSHLSELVIVTDQGNIAENIYRSLGFHTQSYQYGLSWTP